MAFKKRSWNLQLYYPWGRNKEKSGEFYLPSSSKSAMYMSRQMRRLHMPQRR